MNPKILMIAALPAASLAVPAAALLQEETVRLMESGPVSSRSAYVLSRRGFAMGGIAYKEGIVAGEREKGAQVTYSIPEKAARLRFDLGVNDTAKLKGTPKFSVLVDGDEVAGGSKGGDPSQGAKPTPFDLDVKGKRSVQFNLAYGVGIGDPVFVLEPKKPVVAVVQPVRAPGVPDLVSPSEKASVAGEKVMFRWSAVSGAVSYGLSIVSYRAEDEQGGDAPRIWAYTSAGNSFSLDVSKLPRGQYMWSVIAFGPKRPLGAYSAERVLVRE